MTPASFIARFPQFADEDITRIQTFIDDADPYFDVCRWCNHYEKGLGYFVAHNLVIDKALQDGTLSPISSSTDYTMKRVGEVSVARDAGIINKQMNNPFMTTFYGQQYLYLARIVGIGAVAV